MPPREFRAPEVLAVDTLRQAARARVNETSLRVAAGEIGMSHRGLEGFINGARPHPQTVQKLTTWYARRAAEGAFDSSRELVDLALTILANCFPSAVRVQVRTKFAAEFDQVARAHGVALPHAEAGADAARKKDVPGGS
jgi:hypothetical protein